MWKAEVKSCKVRQWVLGILLAECLSNYDTRSVVLLLIVWLLQLYAGVKERMEVMQQHNMSWIEVQFLKKAVDVLCQCRQTLMYTYVFAFYLRKNNQSIIFEV